VPFANNARLSPGEHQQQFAVPCNQNKPSFF
jgi:hypothetical protein